MSAANQTDNVYVAGSTTAAVQRKGVHMNSTSVFYPGYGGAGTVPTYTKVIDVKPNDGDQKGYGASTTWLLEHNITAYLSGLRFRFKVRPPAQLGQGAGTYQRFTDFAGFFHIKRIQLMFSSNLLQEITGDELKFQHFDVYKWEKEQEYRATKVGGNLTEPERDARFLVDQEFQLDIPFWFTLAKQQAIPEVMSQELKLMITFEDYSKVVQSDYDQPPVPAANAIYDQTLELMTTTVASREMEANALNATSANGIQNSIRDIQKIDTTFDSTGMANQDVFFDLRQFNICTQALLFFIREDADVNTPYGNNLTALVGNGNTSEDDLTLQFVTVVGSSRNLKEPVSREHIQSVYWVSHHPSPPGQKVFEVAFSNGPQSASQSQGVEMDFSNVNNPQLKLTLSTTAVKKYRIDIYNINRNIIQYKNGGVRKVFQ